MLGLLRAYAYQASKLASALLACNAGPNLDTILMVVSELTVFQQHLPYLWQQCCCGNIYYPTYPA